MVDALAKRDVPWVDSFIKGARESVHGAVTRVGASGVGPYVKAGGSVAVEVAEGATVGALLGASKARFGIDASPALMGVSAALAVFTADASPAFSAHATAVAGQAAAVMMDRKTQSFLGPMFGGASKAVSGSPEMKSVGPAVAGEGDVGGDRILQTAARIARRQQGV